MCPAVRALRNFPEKPSRRKMNRIAQTPGGTARRSLHRLRWAFLGPLVAFAGQASAHVKWFTEGSYADRPLGLEEVATPLFWQMAVLTVVVVALGVWLDALLKNARAYRRANDWLSGQSDRAVVVMRIALAMTLLLSWQDDAMLVPNLGIKQQWVGWYQFGLAFLLLFPRTVPLAGLGTLVLYGLGMRFFSGFHMLDYLMYIGVGWYLAVSRMPVEGRWRKSGLLVLYLTVGFALCWVALEKLVYPDWAYGIMDKHNLAMGMDNALFLTGAAFVEFGLGFLIIICLLERPLAVLITLVFFTTTLVFGKVEVIGHTLLHGCLIVFLLEGPSNLEWRLKHYLRNVPARMAFAATGFALLLPALLWPYTTFAQRKYENRQNKDAYGAHHEHIPLEVPPELPVPEVELVMTKDPMSGYNLHLEVLNFRWAPEHAGGPPTPGEGHAHLYVNGVKVARVYGDWFHLPQPPEGEYDIEVSLHANGHQMWTYGGEPIRDAERLEVGKVFQADEAAVGGGMPGMPGH